MRWANIAQDVFCNTRRRLAPAVWRKLLLYVSKDMNSWKSSLRVAFAGALCVAVVVCMVIARPEYLTNVEYLGGFLFLEVLAAIFWNYRRRFFPALILVFLLAGTDAKLQDVWSVARWLVLGAGALVGMAIYVKDHSVSSSSSRLFHWIAFSCVVSAAIS